MDEHGAVITAANVPVIIAAAVLTVLTMSTMLTLLANSWLLLRGQELPIGPSLSRFSRPTTIVGPKDHDDPVYRDDSLNDSLNDRLKDDD